MVTVKMLNGKTYVYHDATAAVPFVRGMTAIVKHDGSLSGNGEVIKVYPTKDIDEIQEL